MSENAIWKQIATLSDNFSQYVHVKILLPTMTIARLDEYARITTPPAPKAATMTITSLIEYLSLKNPPAIPEPRQKRNV